VSGPPKSGRGDLLDAARGKARRRAADWRGHWAEATALALLLLKGYRPLARRFRAGGGEIDLVVARGDTIAFVEVKSRAALEAAFVAIDAAKRRRFSRAP
jgi:putative endonuclease